MPVAAPPLFEGQSTPYTLVGSLPRMLQAVVSQGVHLSKKLTADFTLHYLIEAVGLIVN